MPSKAHDVSGFMHYLYCYGEVTCPVGKCVFLVQLLTLLILWASWKELKEQVCYIAHPEKCAEELCPKGLLVQRTSIQHELTLTLFHRQNNLSLTSGLHTFSTLY